jgi:glucose-6-phosphate 1-dehydrogenase
LKTKASEIVIRFRKPPFNLFDSHASIPSANELIFHLQPEGGVAIKMNAKKTGLTTDNESMVMHAPYADHEEVAEAYEILMHDVLTGDGTLFSRSDEVEESWAIVDPILKAWENRVSIGRYRAGSWDIPNIEILTDDCVGCWHKPSAET